MKCSPALQHEVGGVVLVGSSGGSSGGSGTVMMCVTVSGSTCMR